MYQPSKFSLQVLLLVASLTAVHSFIECPPAEETPCFCVPSQNRLGCQGSSITQPDIDNFISLLRTLNKVPPGQWLSLPIFQIRETELTQLNMTSLSLVHFEDLGISSNPNLIKIIGPWTDSEVEEPLSEAQVLEFGHSPLTDESLGSVFKYFKANATTRMYLWFNLLTGGHYIDPSGQIEFLPGFNSQRHVDTIYFNANKITSLFGGQFQRLSRLSRLEFADNPLVQIGEDAFLFDEQDADLLNEPILIDISIVPLNDSGIHSRNGLDSSSRPVSLGLGYDGQLETLTEEHFSNFLSKNELNDITLIDSYLLCDDRMSWIKARRNELESRIIFSRCANDPQNSIFTSNMIN